MELWHELRSVIGSMIDAMSFWELAIVALFALFCIVLRRLDQEKGGKFYFRDLFSSGDWDGKASTPRLGYFGAFLTHSLVVLHQEMKNGIDYAMVSLYALIWSGAYVALKVVDMKAAQKDDTK
jgi:hypothetical protein